MQDFKQCRVCGGNKSKYAFEKNEYRIIQCKSCRFGYLENYDNPEVIKQIYQQDYFDNKQSPDFAKDALKKFSFVSKYFKQPPKVLDFGCALGDFIDIAQRNNCKMTGFDISEFAAKTTQERYQVPVKTGVASKESFVKDYFDGITSFDVIEHVWNFEDVLSYFYEWIKPKGYLFLTTPNIQSWDARLLGKRWYGFTKLPQHINYFSPLSIEMALKNAGFKLVCIKTWGFVRTLEFIFTESTLQQTPLTKTALAVLKRLNLSNRSIYLPMVDMMIVAQKREA